MIVDIDQTYGNDIQVSSSGDLRTVSGSEFGKQRIIRRLLTPTGAYIFHTDYGCGIQLKIGEPLTTALFEEIKTDIYSNIYKESRVAKVPTPQIVLQEIFNGLLCQITYTDTATNELEIISFTVTN